MSIGSRSKPPDVQGERWLKTLSYIVIVTILVWLALRCDALLVGFGCLIVAGGAVELWRSAAASRASDPAVRAFHAASVVVYCGIAVGFLAFLAQQRSAQILFLFFAVFCFDAFSQIIGQILGRHKLAPGISPNKTVEGFFGGVSAAVLAGWIASHWSTIPLWPFWSVVIALSSLAGDLAASHFKRRDGTKDFSNWIPYQGGVLDRFDSLIAAGAASWLFCSAFYGL